VIVPCGRRPTDVPRAYAADRVTLRSARKIVVASRAGRRRQSRRRWQRTADPDGYTRWRGPGHFSPQQGVYKRELRTGNDFKIVGMLASIAKRASGQSQAVPVSLVPNDAARQKEAGRDSYVRTAGDPQSPSPGNAGRTDGSHSSMCRIGRGENWGQDSGRGSA